MKKIVRAQEYLKEHHLDGWLLYDFNHNNPLALDFLEVAQEAHLSRRLFYWLPVIGEPIKIVHRIEPYTLDHLPGKKRTYHTYQQLKDALHTSLQGAEKVAMEYSPQNALPYVSKVDAGTVDMVRECGVSVVSSGMFLQQFTAVLTKQEQDMQREAGKLLDQIASETFLFLSQRLKQGFSTDEYMLQQWVMQCFQEKGLVTEYAPICAFGVHTADPHYSPSEHRSAKLQPNELILLDFVARKKQGVYGDITRMGFSGSHLPEKYAKMFSIARKAQDLGFELVKERHAKNQVIKGYEVDGVCRDFITKEGYGEYFVHRTGHNIDTRSVHGSGAHLDGFETYDDRPLIPGLCFTIEPGIYFPGEWGIRVEYDVLIHDGVEITSGVQESITTL